MPDFRFPKSRRLLKAADFDRVFARRRSQADSTLLVYGCENQAAVARLGLVVSRKCGNAVARNRWKRCIREAFRLAQHELPELDLVVLPRAGAIPETAQVRTSLVELASRVARGLGTRTGPAHRPPEAP